MRSIKLVWFVSLLLTVLLSIDDVAGVDAENGEGLVVANQGVVSGSLSWPLLAIFGSVFIITSLVWIVIYFKSQRK